jgi:glutathione S-transferase
MPMNIEYWSFRGFGHHLRCMAFYLSLDFTETRITPEDAPGYMQRKAMGAASGENPLINLPNITDGDVFVSETTACIAYLLEKAGRQDMLNNTWQREQAISICKDLWRDITIPCFMSQNMPSLVAALNPKLEAFAKFQLPGLAKTLGSKPFLFGDQPVAADFYLADFLEKVAAMDAELDLSTKLVKGNATWEEYLARFFALPKIKEFRESNKCILKPFHLYVAFWGNK